jgi:hypothetical protein
MSLDPSDIGITDYNVLTKREKDCMEGWYTQFLNKSKYPIVAKLVSTDSPKSKIHKQF